MQLSIIRTNATEQKQPPTVEISLYTTFRKIRITPNDRMEQDTVTTPDTMTTDANSHLSSSNANNTFATAADNLTAHTTAQLNSPTSEHNNAPSHAEDTRTDAPFQPKQPKPE